MEYGNESYRVNMLTGELAYMLLDVPIYLAEWAWDLASELGWNYVALDAPEKPDAGSLTDAEL